MCLWIWGEMYAIRQFPIGLGTLKIINKIQNEKVTLWGCPRCGTVKFMGY